MLHKEEISKCDGGRQEAIPPVSAELAEKLRDRVEVTWGRERLDQLIAEFCAHLRETDEEGDDVKRHVMRIEIEDQERSHQLSKGDEGSGLEGVSNVA